nr:MAG TPA: hypothetical protein [Caudoviricetes sp.]
MQRYTNIIYRASIYYYFNQYLTIICSWRTFYKPTEQ